MQHKIRKLNLDNIDAVTSDFRLSLLSLGDSLEGRTGVQLLYALKREKLISGPYPGVTLFEAANRVMSDLVIYYGIAGLLKQSIFPFSEYTVELGNEDNNGFDIRAGDDLVGEAFNVSPSLFQIKKRKSLTKLHNKAKETKIRILMFNADAVSMDYIPKIEDGFYYVFVNIDTGVVRVEPNPLTKI